MIEILSLSVALAIDAAAAAAGLGASQRSLRPVVLGAVLFGVFQSGMSALGSWGGAAVLSRAQAFDHWVAFGLLSLLGSRTIAAALRGGDEREPVDAGLLALLSLSIATSLDALAAGVTLPMLPVSAPVAVATIGIVTFLLSGLGGALGRTLGASVGPKVEVAGGLVLIGLGVKILVEHLSVA